MSSPNDSTDATTSPPADHGHDAAPSGPAYWLVTGTSAVIVALACWLAVKYLVWPGEGGDGHIKRRILREEEP
ncbi:MAG: hypothetical protein ABEL76_04770 [Bradymonadaceae bacterium]